MPSLPQMRTMDEADRRTLERAVRHLCTGADAVCDDVKSGGVPRLNAMTGGYSWDEEYVWDSWANFQWAGFLAGRLWLLHLLAHEQRYAEAAMRICERIGAVLAEHPTVFSSTGIDMYYALTLGYQITKDERLKRWALAGGDNFAAIFDHKAGAFLQIAGADRIVIDTGLNLPSPIGAHELLAKPLIRSRYNDISWNDWFAQRGIGFEPSAAGHLQIDPSYVAIEAAVKGVGVVLESSILTHELVQNGRLVAPVTEQERPAVSYWLLPLRSDARQPTHIAYDWLLDQSNCKH
jgi:hypothetical protein